jgi:hypothetical protein
MQYLKFKLMKKLLAIIIFTLCFHFINRAQNLSLSEEIFIGNSIGYGIIGKLNERVLFFHLDDSKVKIKAFDAKMHKLWDKEVEPERKNHAKIIEVVGSRQDFNVIYHFRKKGHNYLKIHKYDGQIKLLDSTTVYYWGRDMVSPDLKIILSEDKKVALIYEEVSSSKINALAVSLDSLKPLWFNNFELKNWEYDRDFHQILINNKAEAFFIREEDNNQGDLEKHRFSIRHVWGDKAFKDSEIFFKNAFSIDVKFSYDNSNQKLTAVGIYSGKGIYKAQGYFFINTTPQYNEAKITLQLFDDEFVSAIQGKKITDNKGMADLKIQEIVHRRDGGILAIIEQVREVERPFNSVNSRLSTRGVVRMVSVDYFYDNMVAISLSPDGTTDWRSIFFKKQNSQDDDARYCSYFLIKSPSALRFLFNDEIERSTTISEYVLDGKGQSERHSIFNTEGHNVSLRFRDALQIAANEVIVPSDDRRRVKLVKIQY